MDFKKAKKRAEINRQIRDFFDQRDFLEVETPLLSPHLLPEASIENFSTSLISPYREDVPLFLIPSPEIHMKELLAEGSGDIYQICKSFRNSEQISPVHNPEFTMLEWYKTDISAEDNIQICEELIETLHRKETPSSCRGPFRRMTVEEAFQELAGFSLEENLSEEQLAEQVLKNNMQIDEQDDWEVLYHKLFLTLVEPELPMGRPLVLTDYPSRIPTLAKNREGTPWSERWELYMEGIEIANCYTEEINRERIQDFYRNEIPVKQKQGRIPVQFDPHWAERCTGIPPCSGAALGVDRLISVLSGDKTIQGVILFPLDAILP